MSALVERLLTEMANIFTTTYSRNENLSVVKVQTEAAHSYILSASKLSAIRIVQCRFNFFQCCRETVLRSQATFDSER
ncbi:hypothetical protein ABR27_04180 [Enterobacter hormaechei subsp. hormaechei]|nr:hypothetical protein ABR27_04180 [Enterobacter hormaechei subsp. hormaechei]